MNDIINEIDKVTDQALALMRQCPSSGDVAGAVACQELIEALMAASHAFWAAVNPD